MYVKFMYFMVSNLVLGSVQQLYLYYFYTQVKNLVSLYLSKSKITSDNTKQN